MKTCTFFGHRDTPPEVVPLLRAVVEELIEADDVGMFYVGNQGQFDQMVLRVLQGMQLRHPCIRYGVVLEKLPRPKESAPPNAMLPEGLELVHPRYAIARRNEWMVDQADVVVTHVTHDWGGAARYARRARQRSKQVINVDHGDPQWMSVPLMERVLRADADGTGPLTTDLALAIMAELAKKRPHTGHTAQEAWEIFQREYLPKIEAPQ